MKQNQQIEKVERSIIKDRLWSSLIRKGAKMALDILKPEIVRLEAQLAESKAALRVLAERLANNNNLICPGCFDKDDCPEEEKRIDCWTDHAKREAAKQIAKEKPNDEENETA